MVACTDPVATEPEKEQGAKRFLMRGLLVCGPAVAGLDPLPLRSRLQRDAGQVGKKGREKSLCVAKARHAGSEPA